MQTDNIIMVLKMFDRVDIHPEKFSIGIPERNPAVSPVSHFPLNPETTAKQVGRSSDPQIVADDLKRTQKGEGVRMKLRRGQRETRQQRGLEACERKTEPKFPKDMFIHSKAVPAEVRADTLLRRRAD